MVEYVASGSRFKYVRFPFPVVNLIERTPRLFLQKENQVLTLVLGGIRAPRAARNTSEKSEPFGQEALDFATRRYMQRDVEFEVDSLDKQGGFIGTLWINKTENAAIALVKEGFASVHDYSAETLTWARQLYDAQTEAQNNKAGVRHPYVARFLLAEYDSDVGGI
jgi:staphylococcal nuclease domain-containing protein 1